MEKTIQQRTADTILQNPIGSVTIGEQTYEIEAPTTGTLIMISALASELPQLDPDTPREEFVSALIKAAGESESLGQIAATIILGAKRIKQNPIITLTTTEYRRKWSWRKFRFIDVPEIIPTPIYERDYVADHILDNMTPHDLKGLIDFALSEAHLADFFVLTTSLRTTKNLLNPTREVGKATASGHSSEAGLNIGS